MSYYLGPYTADSTQNIRFFFQYVDFTGALTNPTTPPVFNLYDPSGFLVLTAQSMLTSTVSGLYRGNIDTTSIPSVGNGRYTIHAYTPDVGLNNYATYSFEIVPNEGTFKGLADFVTLASTPLADIIADGGLEDAIGKYVWDALLADHVAGDTFGEATLPKDNLEDILSALSIDAGYVAGNDLASIKSQVDLLEKYQSGRWKIDPVAKTMTFYDDDDSTPILVFDLLDAEGTPTTINIAERIPQ
jgi:hypothetical protein